LTPCQIEEGTHAYLPAGTLLHTNPHHKPHQTPSRISIPHHALPNLQKDLHHYLFSRFQITITRARISWRKAPIIYLVRLVQNHSLILSPFSLPLIIHMSPWGVVFPQASNSSAVRVSRAPRRGESWPPHRASILDCNFFRLLTYHISRLLNPPNHLHLFPVNFFDMNIF